MHADSRLVKCNIVPHGSRLDIQGDCGIASVIDAGIGQYTLVFEKDFVSRAYSAVATSDERGHAFERIDLERTKSEYPISVKLDGLNADASVNVVIHG